MSTTDRERAERLLHGSGLPYSKERYAAERVLATEFAAIRPEATKAALEPLVLALKMISAMAPPDDWEYYAGFGDYNGYEGYGRDDPAYVDEPDTSNNGDMLDFGSAIGRQQAAKIARQALREVAAELRGMHDENTDR